MKPREKCTRCHIVRPKGARWFWQDSNARPPVVYCGPCAEIVAPSQVVARGAANRAAAARAWHTRYGR